MCSIKIILPLHLPKKTLYFKGYVQNVKDLSWVNIFVTEILPSQDKKRLKGYENETNCIFGTFRSTLNRRNRSLKLEQYYINYVTLQESPLKYPEIVFLKLKGSQIHNIIDCIVLFYDYEQIKRSESLGNGNFEFTTLQNLIHGKMLSTEKSMEKPDTSCDRTTSSHWITASMLFQHIYNYIYLIKWFFQSIKTNKKITIKHGNLLVAILTDILLGYLVIQLLTPDKVIINITLMENLEKLVNSMNSLLQWLMGAPAGLKLNNAFNKMLGKYFSYHVQLWWSFIEISGEKLNTILDIYHYISYLGITFQAALISDLISIITFHSYCFYVYAARLFNIQISGLSALLRLFVGRKYNPLRNGIDSCEYTNQELFVGTVAFTILLLLLPTTAMYYIVFTAFRLLALLVQYILAKSIYWIQSLPLYVIFLKLIHSPKVAGNILIEVVNSDKKSLLILRINLFSKSIEDLVSTFTPPVTLPSRMEWSGLLSKLFTGKPII